MFRYLNSKFEKDIKYSQLLSRTAAGTGKINLLDGEEKSHGKL
ncbi:MAG: hypothetical protein ACOX2Q_10725 [Dehalobacterium sp.]